MPTSSKTTLLTPSIEKRREAALGLKCKREYSATNLARESKVLSMLVSLNEKFVCLLVGCLTSLQHASVSQGLFCSDNFTFFHTKIEVADQTFHLTQSPYTDTGSTSPSTDPITPDVWQGSYWGANF